MIALAGGANLPPADASSVGSLPTLRLAASVAFGLRQFMCVQEMTALNLWVAQ